VVYQRYGYEVSYGVYWRMGAVYAAVFHQFHSREHNLRVGIAPLAILTVVCLPLLAVPNPVIATTAFVILVLNTAGGAGDLYALWRFYGYHAEPYSTMSISSICTFSSRSDLLRGPGAGSTILSTHAVSG